MWFHTRLTRLDAVAAVNIWHFIVTTGPNVIGLLLATQRKLTRFGKGGSQKGAQKRWPSPALKGVGEHFFLRHLLTQQDSAGPIDKCDFLSYQEPQDENDACPFRLTASPGDRIMAVRS